MYRMFYYAQDFNQDLSNWDIYKVTSMYNMFYYASDLNRNLGWCVEYDVSFSSAFSYSGCSYYSGNKCGVARQSFCQSPRPTQYPTTSPAPTVTPAPTLEGCYLYVLGPKGASQGNVVAYGNSYPNYELSFTMELWSDWSITGELQSILHIGDTDNQRLPGLWFHDTENKMVVAQSHSSYISSTGTFTFTGGDPGEGLDFTGDFVYAVNIRGSGASRLAMLCSRAIGRRLGSPCLQRIQIWPGRSSPSSDPALMTRRWSYLCTAFAYSTFSHANDRVTMEVVEGNEYRLQLLFYDDAIVALMFWLMACGY